MTNTEIKEVIEILKKEGCNSKKQAIEYLEGKLKTITIGDIIKNNPRYLFSKKMVKIVGVIDNRFILESDNKKFLLFLYEGFLETNLEVEKWKNGKKKGGKYDN